MPSVRERLTFANVVSVIALFVALGGTGYAAIKLPKNSVGAKQIKRNAVTAAKVKNRSLLGQDFKAGQLPAGARGAQGIQGAQGILGPPGTPGSDAQFNGAAAGGDLAGSTYPNPEIANGKVDSATVSDGSLRTTDFAVASGTFTINVPQLLAGACSIASPGAPSPGVVQATDIPLLVPTGASFYSNGGLVVTPHIDGSNTINAKVCNVSTATIEPPSETFKWAIIR